ncbi:MAG: phosphate ABC transporter substrate-binding protein, partial [Deltaproteobacteria bacterium]|nr:phosphate ABC transporter substrate-binding protein [Deltaproteobacteria bacterium]
MKNLKMNLRSVGIAMTVLLSITFDAGAKTIIHSRGSDTLMIVAQVWAEIYAKNNPRVAISVSGGGSG